MPTVISFPVEAAGDEAGGVGVLGEGLLQPTISPQVEINKATMTQNRRKKSRVWRRKERWEKLVILLMGLNKLNEKHDSILLSQIVGQKTKFIKINS